MVQWGCSSIITRQIEDCKRCFTKNIEKGITEGLYRNDLKIPMVVKFYYELIFSINDQEKSELEISAMEYQALEYHIRAIATPNGITELEKQLSKSNN